MEWMHTWSREYGVQYCEAFIQGLTRTNESLLGGIRHTLFYPEGKNQANHISKEDWETMQRKMAETIENERTGSEIEKFVQNGEAYLSLAQTMAEKDSENAATDELLEWYHKYRERWSAYTAHLWTMFFFPEFVSQKVEEILRQKMTLPEADFERLAYFASKPEKNVGVLELNQELHALRGEYSDKKRCALHEKYQWVSCLDLHNPPMGETEFTEYIMGYRPPLEPDTDGIEQFLNETEHRWISLNRKFAYIKDLRDYYRRKGVFYIQKLYAEMASRMGLSLRQISYVRDSEIQSFFREGKRPAVTDIEKRMANGFLMYEHNGELKCIVENVENHAAQIGFRLTRQEHERIRGKVASRGRIRGRVRIVHSKLELSKVLPGDILVAVTTDANYMVAMNNAAAFVVDQGGILSHAAIVAREMKKPCIVGTGNATKRLKDGDWIEIDDETGEVRKVSALGRDPMLPGWKEGKDRAAFEER